jgi:hypothetical protein
MGNRSHRLRLVTVQSASQLAGASAPHGPGQRINPMVEARGRIMSNIGGNLDMAALGRMHFHVLSREQQAQAIRRLAAGGQGEHTIAHATGLSVEFIRRILAEAVA